MMKLRTISEAEVERLICDFKVRYWDDSELDRREDDAQRLQMPGAKAEEGIWHVEIDAATGKVKDWPQGLHAHINYKVCDGCLIRYILKDGREVEYTGYVPEILDTYGEGYGDYLVFDIDKDGFILDWCQYHDIVDLTGED